MAEIPVPDPSTEQLRNDIQAVFRDKTKSLSDFPPDYQLRLRTAYRFSGYLRFSDQPNQGVPMNRETMDLI
jgi:hypothetical protein